MATDLDTDQLKTKYSSFSDNEVRSEFQKILSIPNARTDVEALTRLSVLLPEMKKRGMKEASGSKKQSSFNWGSAMLGLLLIVGGIALSANTGRIFYGAVLVGIAMIIKSAL